MSRISCFGRLSVLGLFGLILFAPAFGDTVPPSGAHSLESTQSPTRPARGKAASVPATRRGSVHPTKKLFVTPAPQASTAH
jgi:hypothetical protein